MSHVVRDIFRKDVIIIIIIVIAHLAGTFDILKIRLPLRYFIN